jgi:hypothetical protein
MIALAQTENVKITAVAFGPKCGFRQPSPRKQLDRVIQSDRIFVVAHFILVSNRVVSSRAAKCDVPASASLLKTFRAEGDSESTTSAAR